jgi:hypothetical protein
MSYEYVNINDYINPHSINDVVTFNDPSKITNDVRDACIGDGWKGARSPDYLTPLLHGREWLLELTKIYQPKTGTLLSTGGQLCLRKIVRKNGSLDLSLAIEIGGRTVLINRALSSLNRSDDNFKPLGGDDRAMSLPVEIREAYYNRFDGLNIPRSSAPGIHTWLLPIPIFRPWKSWDGYLEKYKGYKYANRSKVKRA